MLMTAYSAGLRVSELVRLRVDDVDADRGTIHVVQGKGMRDRYTVLSSRLLSELRTYWKEEQPYKARAYRSDRQAPNAVAGCVPAMSTIRASSSTALSNPRAICDGSGTALGQVIKPTSTEPA